MTPPEESPMQLLGVLSAVDATSKHEMLVATKNFLYLAFDVYTSKRPLASAEQRQEAAELLEKSAPIIEKGLFEILVSLNADKRTATQQFLSGLKFIVDDFGKDCPKLGQVLHSDMVIDINEYVNNSWDSSTAAGVSVKVDLKNVPRSHSWWRKDFKAE